MNRSVAYSALVGAEHHGIKLFKFCHVQFPALSKKDIHDMFKSGNVSLNGQQITDGASSETKKVSSGDKIDCTHAKVVHQEDLFSVIHREKRFAIVSKPAGVASGFGSPFDMALKSLLWKDTASNSALEVNVLFRPQKSQQSLCVVTADSSSYSLCRQLLCLGLLRPVFKCLTAGYVGDFGSVHCYQSPVTKSHLNVRVMSVSRSRLAGSLSMLEVVPTFNASMMCDCTAVVDPTSKPDEFMPDNICVSLAGTTNNMDSDSVGEDDEEDNQESPLVTSAQQCKAHASCVQHPTLCLRQIVRVLGRNGLKVVGDEGVVKSSKGTFSWLERIELNISCFDYLTSDADSDELFVKNLKASIQDSNAGICWEVPLPPKFAKVMEREESYFQKAALQGAQETSEASGDTSDLPVEYLTGYATFLKQRFKVDNRVMIPRPASETLVLQAFKHYKDSLAPERRNLRVLDLGTGSGCLLLSLLNLCQQDRAQTGDLIGQ
jgi:hypothetical protein